MKLACVVVPLYRQQLSFSEDFSFNRTLETLGGYDIYVICPYHLQASVEGLRVRKGSAFRIRSYPDEYFSSIAGYNRLMVEHEFYADFSDYEYMLVVQTDALVISNRLADFCEFGFSYIGAPWFDGFHNPVEPYRFFGVGNGGFSLRKISDFKMVLASKKFFKIPAKAYPGNSLRERVASVVYRFLFSHNDRVFFPRVNEDIFWGLIAPASCVCFEVPDGLFASKFSFEVLPRYLFKLNDNELPFGCHAWERYDKEFWEEKLGAILFAKESCLGPGRVNAPSSNSLDLITR